MALSQDQKAMLRLLAQREQGYDDIGALMGIGVDEVRAKVKAALDGLDGSLSQDQKAILRMQAQREEGYGDIAALMGISVDEVRSKVKDALAGLDHEAAVEAKPPEPPPPAPPEPEPPAPPAPTPAAKPAAAPKPQPSAATTAAKTKPASPRLKLPEDKGAQRALVAGGAVVVVIVLLLVTGVLGGSDDSGSGSSTTATTGAETTPGGESGTPTANGKQPTQAVLSPVDGGNGRGQALFGRSGKTVILLFSAKGLQPSPAGQSYTVSLVRSKNQRLPVIVTKTKNGVIAGRFKVEPGVLGLLAGGFDQMELSLVDDNTLRVAVAQARKSKKAPNYGGTPVLSGPVTGPIVEAGEAEAEN